MKRACISLAWLAAALLAGRSQGFAGTLPTPATGASVDETRVTKTLFVDPANADAADDDKHGASEAPFATLRYACEAAARAKDDNVGVKIVVASGTYREAVVFPRPALPKRDTDAPLVIEAAERDQAIIDGADTEGWTPSTWKMENGVWTHPWPFVRRPLPPPHATPGVPLIAYSAANRAGDLLFVNGTALRQVNTREELVPGSFWGLVTHLSPGKGRSAFGSTVIVQPPADTDLEGAIVQVSARRQGLVIDSRRNVVVRGLMCQHAADPTGGTDGTAGIEVIRCDNVLIEDVLSQWNDGAGLSVEACSNVTMRRVRLLHNGWTGLGVGGITNLLVEDGEASFNHFRGEWSGWVAARMGAAIEAGSVRGSTWRRIHAVGNTCQGLWFTAGNLNLTIEDAVVADNLVCGLDISSASSGPVLVRRCLVTGTKGHPSLREGIDPLAGVSLSALPDVTLESCVVAGNAGTQLSSLWGNGVEPAWPTARHTYRHNVFAGNDATQMICVLPTGERTDKPAATLYYETLSLDENCFWNPALAEAFTFVNPNDRRTLHKSGAGIGLAEWRALLAARNPRLAEDKSLWQDPQFASPEDGDYRLKATGPLAGWDLPTDDATANQ